MSKPNSHIDLTKTNYFANLKRKAKNPKDTKEQAAVNMELLNCVDILEKRIKTLEAAFVSLGEKHNEAMKAIASNMNYLKALMEKDESNGGEPMDA